MKSRISATIFTALAFCLLTVFASAQTKQPNLTGTWKMNAEKSKFEQGGPSAITIKFDHKDSSLSETLTLTNDNNDRSVDLKYTTDGKETPQDVMGRNAQTSAKWEGDALMINWKADGDGDFSRKITVSADGKTMTMIVKQSTSTDTVVLEKQDAK
ncbi:MAG: hypothetical protein AAB401_03035 [Acidobacteriota bacterium]